MAAPIDAFSAAIVELCRAIMRLGSYDSIAGALYSAIDRLNAPFNPAYPFDNTICRNDISARVAELCPRDQRLPLGVADLP